MAAPAGQAISFYLQLEDNMSPVLSRIERGYNRVVRSIDNMNRVVQKRSTGSVAALERLTSDLEQLPARMTRAATRLSTAVNTALRKSIGGTSKRGGSGEGAGIANVVERAVERAMRKMSLRLQASLPKRPKDSHWDTRQWRESYKNMPPPPDYSGGFQAFATGGVVKGGKAGADSVPAMLTPGEVVLPVWLVNAMQRTMGHKPISGYFASGGEATSGAGRPILEFAADFERSADIMSTAGIALFAAVNNTVGDFRRLVLPVAPWEKWELAMEQAQFPAGGVISNRILESLETANGYLAPMASGILGMRGLTAVLQNVTSIVGGARNVIQRMLGMVGYVKAKLGIKQEESLVPGATKALLAASFAAAAWIERDWKRVQLAIAQTPGTFQEVRRIGLDAMVEFGSSTEQMFTSITKLADEQKRSGKDLEDTMKLVNEFALDNEALADRTADLTWEFKKLGIQVGQQRKIFSAFIEVGRDTTLTLEDIIDGTKRATDGLAQITIAGGNSEDAVIGLNAVAGVMKDHFMDAGKAYDIFNAVLDPTRVGDVAGLLNMMALHTGKTEGELRDMITSGTGVTAFFNDMIRTVGAIDITKIGEMEAALAQVSEAGVDKDLITSIHLMSKTKGIGNFANEISGLMAASIEAANAGKLMRERWDEYASTIGVAWQKVKNAFYAILIQIGEPVLDAFRPIFQMFTWFLTGIATLLNGLSYPIRVLMTLAATILAFSGPITVLASLYGSFHLLRISIARLVPLLMTMGGAFTRFVFAPINMLVYKLFPELGMAMAANYMAVTNWLRLLVTSPLAAFGKLLKWLTIETWKNTIATLKEAAAHTYNAIAMRANAVAARGLARSTGLANTASLAQVGTMGVAAKIWPFLVGLFSIAAVKIIAIVAIVSAAFLVLYDIFDTGGRRVSDFFWTMQEALGNASTYVRKNWGSIGQIVGWVIDRFRQAAAWFSGLFAAIWEHSQVFWDAFGPIWQDVSMALDQAFSLLWSSLKQLFGITDTGSKSMVDLSHDFSWVADVIWYVGKAVGAAAWMIGGAIGAVVVIVAKAIDAISAVVDYVWQPFALLIDGFRELSKGNFLWGLVKIVGGVVSAIVKLFLGIPGLVASAFWGLLPDGWKEWIYNTVTWPFRAVIGVVTNMWNGIATLLNEVINSLVSMLSNIGGEMAGSRVTAVGEAGQQMVDWGFSLSRVDIPTLQEGGIIPGTPEGTMALVAEGGTTEAVMPLDRLSEFIASETDMTKVEALLGQIRDILATGTRGRRQTGSADPMAMALLNNYQVGGT